MKTMLKSLMSVAVAALAFTSCSNDATEEVTPNGGSKTLEVNASIDQTRTVMADNHINLEWAESDEIYLYIGETATKDDVKKIKPKTGGKITNVTYQEGDKVYANYSLGNSYSNGVTQAEIKIDKEQKQTAANVFAGENLPMVAKGAIENGSVSLNFQPVGCVLVFNVYGSAYNANEKIKSIKFETSVGCCGYDRYDLTAESLGYKAYEKSTSAEVTLTTPATIGAAKPSDTKVGENQVYLVLAPVNYTDATITVNTTLDSEKIFNTYTFTTANGIDCSTNTARVVNLNLARAAVVPSIEVPTVPQQESKGGGLQINNIVFKNISADYIAKAGVKVYANAELTQELDGADAWFTINENIAPLAGGTLNCTLTANKTTASRTAYIVIECAGIQSPAIAVTQVAQGASTDKYYVKVTEALEDWTGDYLIVYEDESKAYNGALTTNFNNTENCTEVTITEERILSYDATDKLLVKISKNKEATDEYMYMLQTASGFYLYSSAAKKTTVTGNKDYDTAAQHPHSINIENGSAIIKSKTTSRFLGLGTTGPYFRYYTSYNTSQKAIQLYKLQ